VAAAGTRTVALLLLLAGPALLPAGGCGTADENLAPGPVERAIRIDPEAGPRLLLDALTIRSLWVEGDSLFLEIAYGGGCRVHQFDAVAGRDFEGLEPPRLTVYLRHDADGEACEAHLTDTLSFHDGRVLDLFRQSGHDPAGSFIYRIVFPEESGSLRSVEVERRLGSGAG